MTVKSSFYNSKYLKKFIRLIWSFIKNLFQNMNILSAGKEKTINEKKLYSVAIIHFTSENSSSFRKLVAEFNIELRSADIIVGKNISPEDFLGLGISLKNKNFLFTFGNDEQVAQQGHLVGYINDFDVKKLKQFEKRKTKILITNDKQTAWMISQMFPFYCIIPSPPFQETVITAPIPLTRNSDGYYFTKVSYRNQITVIDLDVDILNDFKRRVTK